MKAKGAPTRLNFFTYFAMAGSVGMTKSRAPRVVCSTISWELPSLLFGKMVTLTAPPVREATASAKATAADVGRMGLDEVVAELQLHGAAKASAAAATGSAK